METLLILGGLLLFLAGSIWLVSLAFGRSLLWGIASLVPPLALIFVLRHWNIARKAVVLAALGWIPMVVGLTLLAGQDSTRLDAILGFKWLRPEPAAQPELAIKLRGSFRGKPFAPDNAELIDGVLSLREGDEFYASREVQIRLPKPVNGPLRLDVLPEDRGVVPEIEINWLEPDHDLPEAERVQGGYTLHLDLTPEPPNRMRGAFHLVLPAEYDTTLSGNIELYTDRLRYRNGEVDTRFDSQDTLVHVLRDYLQRRFARRDVELGPLPRLDFRRRELSVPVSFRAGGQPQSLKVELYRADGKGWAVRDDNYRKLPPATPAVATAPATQEQPEAIASSAAEVQEQTAVSLEQLRMSPQGFLNRRMRVVTASGNTAEGTFAGFDSEGQIVIRRVINGPGEVVYSLRASEVLSIELLPR